MNNKTKQASEQPAQQKEPVAMYEDWYDSNSCGHCGMVNGHAKTCRHYTTPLQCKPLTDEEIETCRQQGYDHRGLSASFDFVKAARAIEAAHGIKGPP